MEQPIVGHVWLEHLYCREAQFKQLKSPGVEPIRVLSGDFPMEFSLRCVEQSQELLDVEIGLRVEADASAPYDVSVTFVGRFRINSLPEGTTLRDLATQNAVSIMFPFIREAVASITAKGSFGPILLPPINAPALLENAEGQDITAKKISRNAQTKEALPALKAPFVRRGKKTR